MPAHVACQQPDTARDSTSACFVVCLAHGLRQGFGSSHVVAEAACALHNRLHHPDPRSARDRVLLVIYDSRATRGFSGVAVSGMLDRARIRNRAFGITGMLLAQHGWFLQALEGPELIVADLMRAIEADRRHGHVRVLARETRGERRFPDWAMAYGHLDDVEALPSTHYYEGLLLARGAAESAAHRDAGRPAGPRPSSTHPR